MVMGVEYLYFVLVPVAEEFRKQALSKNGSFVAINSGRKCRIKFSDKTLDKNWQAFCAQHELKNDSRLEY